MIYVEKCHLACPSCGHSEDLFFLSTMKKSNRKCPSCGNELVVEQCDDGMEDLVDMAEATGAEVHFISTDTDQGSALQRAFGGIAGILRYKLHG